MGLKWMKGSFHDDDKVQPLRGWVGSGVVFRGLAPTVIEIKFFQNFRK